MTNHSSTQVDDFLLQVDGLNVWYGKNHVVRDVQFQLRRGQALALIGESGSGKSTITKALLGLLPEGVGRADGRVLFEGQNLLALSQRGLRKFRGSELGYVPQDPGTALNAVRTIGSQAHEAADLTGVTGIAQQRELILETFEQVGLPDPQRVYDSYPHQLSGGMLQRVLIALTVLPRPALIVADEPTSALDVTVQKTILDLLDQLRTSLNIGLLLITHDLALAAERTDHLVVLRQGQVQEEGTSAQIFANPQTDYAKRLLSDVPSLSTERYRDTRGRLVEPITSGNGVIRVEQVVRHFGAGSEVVKAVDGVSFEVARGSTHALVGESGSGKTTTVRMLVGLEAPSGGRITLAGKDLSNRNAKEWREARAQLQLVYQNPFASLDPSWSVARIIQEPLARLKYGTRAEQKERVLEVLAEVGLNESFLTRRPAQLSGGQRQRVAIARALSLRPEILVLDEPTSALDVSVQADIVDLLAVLQREHSLTYLFVSHDLALVRQVADTVSVMRNGVVIESGTSQKIFENPEHAYTKALIASVPSSRGESTLGATQQTPNHTYAGVIA